MSQLAICRVEITKCVSHFENVKREIRMWYVKNNENAASNPTSRLQTHKHSLNMNVRMIPGARHRWGFFFGFWSSSGAAMQKKGINLKFSCDLVARGS